MVESCALTACVWRNLRYGQLFQKTSRRTLSTVERYTLCMPAVPASHLRKDNQASPVPGQRLSGLHAASVEFPCRPCYKWVLLPFYQRALSPAGLAIQ
jgi:hypothetical protein